MCTQKSVQVVDKTKEDQLKPVGLSGEIRTEVLRTLVEKLNAFENTTVTQRSGSEETEGFA